LSIACFSIAEVGMLSAQETGALKASHASHVAILSDVFIKDLLSHFLAIASANFLFH
jgi:hypothetical protein